MDCHFSFIQNSSLFKNLARVSLVEQPGSALNTICFLKVMWGWETAPVRTRMTSDTGDTETSRMQHKVNKDKQKERLHLEILRPQMGVQRQTTTYMSLYVALTKRWLVERTCNQKNANRKTKPEKLTLPNIFPSPISPVLASSIMVSITDSTCEKSSLKVNSRYIKRFRVQS